MLGALSPDDKKKLESFVEVAKRQLQEIDDIRGSLKDATKHVADELGVKPKNLTKAVKSAYKNDFASAKDEMAEVEDILNVTGYA